MKFRDNTYNYFGIPPPPGYNTESIVIESADIRHGFNCDCCTSVKDSQRFGDEYEKKIRQLHKGKYTGVRAQRAKKQELQKQQENLALPKQDNSNPMEDFEPI